MINSDHLATFGDSWPAGVGLWPKDEKPYGALLCDRLQIKNFYNGSIPRSSVSRLLPQLFDYISCHATVKNHIAIFFITTPGRSLLVDYNKSIIDFNTPPPSDSPDRVKNITEIYYKYLSTAPMDEFNVCRTMLALQQVCSQVGIQDFYISGWIEMKFDWPGIEKQKIYPKTCTQILGYNQDEYLAMQKVHSKYFLPCRHPNSHGHQLIADYLYDWIKHKNVQPPI